MGVVRVLWLTEIIGRINRMSLQKRRWWLFLLSAILHNILSLNFLLIDYIGKCTESKHKEADEKSYLWKKIHGATTIINEVTAVYKKSVTFSISLADFA